MFSKRKRQRQFECVIELAMFLAFVWIVAIILSKGVLP